MKDEVRRLRGMLSELGTTLQKLTTSLAASEADRDAVSARRRFIEDLRAESCDRAVARAERAIDWEVQVDDGDAQHRPAAAAAGVARVVANAFLHERGEGQIVVHERETDTDELRFTIREPKKAFAGSIEQWGLRAVSEGEARALWPWPAPCSQYHRGPRWAIDRASMMSASSSLITTVVLPIGPGA